MEPKVSIYDPVLDAYREISLEQAKKYLDKVEETVQRIEAALEANKANNQ